MQVCLYLPDRNGGSAFVKTVWTDKVEHLGIGDEPDAIIAADISPDEKRVAIGCTSRLVKLYSMEDGKRRLTSIPIG